ncbi:glycosyltransferase [Nocardioides mangrovicus]|uniref:glycosyltransferase n=1 Tax=Nocardioides mangrovicus TaxID=2478913 RepID=UPI001314448B|nr:glycosyltransferase [Nocardioides mangrovicus]
MVVAVPAQDEAATIETCLQHVMRAAARAVEHAHADVVVAVAAHRCRDATEQLSRDLLGRAAYPGVRGLVFADHDATTVGEVRARLIERVAAEVPMRVDTWIFNTDADSAVSSDWITRTLEQAEHTDARLVLGLVDLDRWTAPPSALEAYARLVSEGMRPGGHDHVYGANLAVRWDVYRQVGGFTAELPEDRGLVNRVRAAQHRVLSTLEPVVLTSSREQGRSGAGLADLLALLSGTQVVTER